MCARFRGKRSYSFYLLQRSVPHATALRRPNDQRVIFFRSSANRNLLLSLGNENLFWQMKSVCYDASTARPAIGPLPVSESQLFARFCSRRFVDGVVCV